MKKNTTGLPDLIKTGIESLSGHSMDDVKVHYNSSFPAQLNAHAYAVSTDIPIGSDQQQHLSHETWHLVQSKKGSIHSSLNAKSEVSINDDQKLEHEADLMRTQALQQKSDPDQSRS